MVVYKDNSRLNGLYDFSTKLGYVKGVEDVLHNIDASSAVGEEVNGLLRKKMNLYPLPAIREIVINALIHQDLLETGSSVLIEVFKDRMEVRNPGKPLISTQRFVDAQPKSRNEVLVRAMRQINFYEERGSGIDKVVSLCESSQMPAPTFKTDKHNTIVSIYAPKSFSEMYQDERVQATYWHACLKFVNNEFMNNQSLRIRFNVKQSNYPQISRVIKKTIDAGLIDFKDSKSKTGRNVQYIPFWGK